MYCSKFKTWPHKSRLIGMVYQGLREDPLQTFPVGKHMDALQSPGEILIKLFVCVFKLTPLDTV